MVNEFGESLFHNGNCSIFLPMAFENDSMLVIMHWKDWRIGKKGHLACGVRWN
jgi:hypothetical protein